MKRGLSAVNTDEDRANNRAAMARGHASSWDRRVARQIRAWESAGALVSVEQLAFARRVEAIIGREAGDQ